MKAILILCIAVTVVYSWEPPDTVWTKTYELDNCCAECFVLNCENGNYLLGGSASETLFVHPRATLMEISPSGDVNWMKEYNNTVNAESAVINTIVERENGYLIGGACAGQNNQDYFLLEVDSSGEPLSCIVSGIQETDWVCGGVETTDGGYAFCGAINDQMLLARYDSNLSLEWTGAFGSTSYENFAYQLVETSDGGFVLAGDVALSQSNDYCMIKVDSSGNLVWEKAWLDTSYWGRLEDVHETSSGDLVCLGRSNSGVHLFKFDSNGDLIWERVFPGRSARDFEPTIDGGYVIAGCGWGVWLARVNEVGELVWETEVDGGTIAEESWTLAETDGGGYIVAAINNPQTGWLQWFTLCFGSCLGVQDASTETDQVIQIIGQPDPNPFSTTFSISLSMSLAAPVSIEIHDTSGRLVRREYYACLSEGVHQIQLDSTLQLPSGWYGVRVTTGEEHDEVAVLKL